jgi:hypothetical protein
MKLILHSQHTKAPGPHGQVVTYSCLRKACNIGTRLVYQYNSAATPLDSLPPLVLFLCSDQPHKPATRRNLPLQHRLRCAPPWAPSPISRVGPLHGPRPTPRLSPVSRKHSHKQVHTSQPSSFWLFPTSTPMPWQLSVDADGSSTKRLRSHFNRSSESMSIRQLSKQRHTTDAIYALRRVLSVVSGRI